MASEKSMASDILMGGFIKILIYLALIFGCIYIYMYDIQMISLSLFMGAWLGLIALFVGNKLDRLIALKTRQLDEWDLKKSQYE